MLWQRLLGAIEKVPGSSPPPQEIYDETCLATPSTYSDRVNVPEAWNWCTVPLSAADVIVVAGVAVVIACLCKGKWAMILTLVIGFAIQALLIPWNWAPYLGNGIAWWLGIQPYELFFYIFLPPLLLDAALRIDMFRLKKVWVQVVVLAYLIVLTATAVMIPILLYVFNLRTYGWKWQHAALFGSLISPTDAVAIVAVLKECGSPHDLRAMLEGESLLNDASAITLFTIFIVQVGELALPASQQDSEGEVVLKIFRKIVVLGVGGLAVGLAFGIGMHIVMRWLARSGASRDVMISLTLAAGYLSFYVANSPCKFSGVISVAVFGLYGAATSKWDGGPRLEEGGAFDAFWDALAYVVNSVVFFFSGIVIANYVIRGSNDLVDSLTPAEYVATIFLSIPIWITIFICRGVLLFLFRPLYWLIKSDLKFKDNLFITFSGLRGCVTLIMAQAVVLELTSTTGDDSTAKAQVVLFATLVVLLTLLVQAPLLAPVIRALKLTVQSPQRLEVRRRAVEKLYRGTDRAVKDLQDDEDEMLKGVNWDHVQVAVSLRQKYADFLNPNEHGRTGKWFSRKFHSMTARFKRPKSKNSAVLAPAMPQAGSTTGATADAEVGNVNGTVGGTANCSSVAIREGTIVMDSVPSTEDSTRMSAVSEEKTMESGDTKTSATFHEKHAAMFGRSKALATAYSKRRAAALNKNALEIKPSDSDADIGVQLATRKLLHTEPIDAENGHSVPVRSDDTAPPRSDAIPAADEDQHSIVESAFSDEDDDGVPFAGERQDKHDLTAVDVNATGHEEEESGVDTQQSYMTLNGETAAAAAAAVAAANIRKEATDAEVADLRVRLCAGLKHHFHHKMMEGLLDTKSQRLLNNACDSASDQPHLPLNLWRSVIEQAIFRHRLTQVLGRFTLRLRRSYLNLKSWNCCGLTWLKRPLVWALSKFTRAMLRFLSKRLSVACGIAIEYQLALVHSPLVAWLVDSHASRQLLTEVQAEVQQVERFLLARELEAPDRFRAIQTHRATLAVIRRQVQTVRRLHEYGMIDEDERNALLGPILANERRTIAKGPVTEAPRMKAVLATLPFLRDAPRDLLNIFLTNGKLVECAPDSVINTAEQLDFMFVVVQGLVQMTYVLQGRTKEYYLSSGAVFGLYGAVAGRPMPGGGIARAMNRANGHGPLVFRVSRDVLGKIETMAASPKPGTPGDPIAHQLLVDIHRTAALYVLERLRPCILAIIVTLLQEMSTRVQREAPEGVPRTAAEAVSDERQTAARQRLAALFAGAGDDEDAAGAGAQDDVEESSPVASEAPLLKAEVEEASKHLGVSRTPSQASLPPTGPKSLVSKALVQACRKQARHVYDLLRPLLLDAQLLDIVPGARYMQSTTVFLVKGSFTTASSLMKTIKGPGVQRNADGSRTFQAPFVLPWVWDSAPETIVNPAAAPAFIEFHADAVEGARVLVALDDGTAEHVDNNASVTGYRTLFSLGRNTPPGQDLRAILRTLTSGPEEHGAAAPPGRTSMRQRVSSFSRISSQGESSSSGGHHAVHNMSGQDAAHSAATSTPGAPSAMLGQGASRMAPQKPSDLARSSMPAAPRSSLSFSDLARPSMAARLRLNKTDGSVGLPPLSPKRGGYY